MDTAHALQKRSTVHQARVAAAKKHLTLAQHYVNAMRPYEIVFASARKYRKKMTFNDLRSAGLMGDDPASDSFVQFVEQRNAMLADSASDTWKEAVAYARAQYGNEATEEALAYLAPITSGETLSIVPTHARAV